MIITYIEEKFKDNKKPVVRNLVDDQFKGKIAYITVCKKCNNKSVNETEFYELELNVKVLSSTTLLYF